MEKLELKLGEKVFTAQKPKMKLYRELEKINLKKNNASLDEIYNVIMAVFPSVTPEMLDNDLEIEELFPLFAKINDWFGSLLVSKMAQFPNETSPTN